MLTQTNDEAMLLSGLLLQQGVTAKLIQSNEGFNLGNLYEIRYFSDLIHHHADSPLITDEDWDQAKRRLHTHIHTSSSKELANAIINTFEEANTAKKYKSDWKAFLFESKVEDFISIDAEVVYVATIHKAKGKEFDNVYLLLNNFVPGTDAQKRQFYVAITRAKTNLAIHYNGHYLQPFSIAGLVHHDDNNPYPQPQHITVYLTLKDVQLWYFERVQPPINHLFSGASLQLHPDGLANAQGALLLRYSQRFREVLHRYADKGFSVAAARVNFVVYWKDEDKGIESKIILPRLLLKKG